MDWQQGFTLNKAATAVDVRVLVDREFSSDQFSSVADALSVLFALFALFFCLRITN
jgi:hypothetical protein